MKNINVILFGAAIILSGCAAHFDRYPGEKLSSFPEEMRGDYFEHNKSWIHYLFKKDTAQISIRKDSILLIAEKNSSPIVLGDSVVFSRFGNYYAFSQLDSKNSWSVTIIKFSKNDLESFSIEENKPYSQKLLQLFTSDTYVHLNDGSSKKIVASSETKFRVMRNGNDTSVVFKMNEEGLKIFFDTYLSKEPHSHFRRIKN
ncbi:MAG: hypothetical protein ACHQK8_00915 [Bacteroidia bacterium]